MLYPAELLRLIFIFLLPRKGAVTKLLYPLPTQIASAQGNKTKLGQHYKMQLVRLPFTVPKQRKSRGNILATTLLSSGCRKDTPFWNIPRDIWFTCHPIYCANPEQTGPYLQKQLRQ